MPIKRETETIRGIFTIRERLYESGLIEISFYTNEVLEGAGPILRGMISRQDSKCKFVGYTASRNRVAIGRKKEDVILATIAEIEIDMRRNGSMRFYTYDDLAAKREGWALFICDDGITRIQRLDDPRSCGDDFPADPVFDGDEAAVVFVRRRAREGSYPHKDAVRQHGISN